uniref:Bromodomain adjacent to zinc finger domain, 1A n=1 Tax=Tetraodon nigroviridis TaxID=99883 RepID=H3CA71_TETNG
MPLLHRKPFTRQKPPADLRPDEEVFLCKITYEVFRSYASSSERTILCNSLVWSCALTGRAGLTYLEAMESERRARQSLKSFPASLVVPLLHLAAISRCSRLSDLCEDVYLFVKNRFFPGEAVEVTGRNGARQVCEILQVHSPYSTANGAPAANRHPRPADSDSIVISDSDDESHALQSLPPTAKGRKKPLSPSVFKYTVRRPISPTTQRCLCVFSRRKATVSRERLKLLFKQHCEPVNGSIAVKVSAVTKYQLCEQTFSQFFPDDSPMVSVSSAAKGGGWSSPGQANSSLLKEKLKLLQQKQEVAAARRAFCPRSWIISRRWRPVADVCHEREKLKEEKKKYAERLKLWNKPREDMECEDLKDLPSPVPVRTRLSPELFGEALMVLEFLQAFGQVFDLKDEFPDGVSLEVLEEALVGSDPEGPLCELLFFFLSAVFQGLDEEQEEGSKEQAEDLSEVLDDDGEAPPSALSAVASLAAVWPQLFQGCSLKQLDLDSCTLSEILRLHILSSGADCYHGNAKLRHQKQGGFTLTDDPCVELRLAEAELLKRLATTAVYDLTPGEKLKILQALVGKLLTLASTRELIEECVEEQRSARQDLREIRAEQHRRQREEAALRVRLRKEEKLKEQEEKLRENGSDSASSCRDEHGGLHAEEKQQQVSQTKMKGKSLVKTKEPTSDLGPSPGSLTAEEQEKEQEKIQELQERIQKAAACTCLLPLGRDRLYRRYWLLPSAATLFVEDDSFGLTEEMLQPQQSSELATETGLEEEEVKAEPAEGSAGSVPAPLYSSGLSVQRHNQWSFYSSMEEVDHLIEALNPRGHREGSLKEALLQERDRLQLLMQSCSHDKYSHTGEDHPESSRSVPECTATAETVMEGRLRDLLLDMEDRIYQGTLGSPKVKDRQVWRSALEAGNYQLLSSSSRGVGRQTEHVHAQPQPVQPRAGDRLGSEQVTPCSGGPTPQVNSQVHHLAEALSHIEQGIERRFLKPPLGEEDPKKEQKMRKSKKK